MLGANPAPSLGESQRGAQSASAVVRIQVVVQPYVRILRNQHPRTLSQQAHGTEAEQQLSIRTNQAHGFCLDLIPADAGSRLQWHLQSAHGDDISITPLAQGYRLCGHRQGQYDISLNHRFPDTTPGEPWPLLALLSQP